VVALDVIAAGERALGDRLGLLDLDVLGAQAHQRILAGEKRFRQDQDPGPLPTLIGGENRHVDLGSLFFRNGPDEHAALEDVAGGEHCRLGHIGVRVHVLEEDGHVAAGEVGGDTGTRRTRGAEERLPVALGPAIAACDDRPRCRTVVDDLDLDVTKVRVVVGVDLLAMLPVGLALRRLDHGGPEHDEEHEAGDEDEDAAVAGSRPCHAAHGSLQV